MEHEEIKGKFQVIDEWKKHHESQLKEHRELIGRLDTSINELQERFGETATHKDVLELHNKIDDSVNGLLKDALASVPQKTTLIFTIVMALIAVAQLILSHTK